MYAWVESTDSTTPMSNVWREIKIKGIAYNVTLHPYPERASLLLPMKCCENSSLDNLPLSIRRCSIKSKHKNYIDYQCQLLDKADAPFTCGELLVAIKASKGTARGDDGIAYDIIRFVQGYEKKNLDLFKLNYTISILPTTWKQVTILPLPKPGRPIENRPMSDVLSF